MSRKLGPCQHRPGAPRFGLISRTLVVNSQGTRQICVGCDWSRPLKKWERAFRAWAKELAEERQVPCSATIGNLEARLAFEAGWRARKHRR